MWRMNDGYTGFYDDDTHTEDTPSDVTDQDSSDDGADGSVSDNPSSGSSGQDSSDDDTGGDGADRPDAETYGESSVETETEETPGTEESGKPEDGSEDMEGEGEAEMDVSSAADLEILLDIEDVLHSHAATVDGFISGLTVSGNSLQISLDPGSAVLLAESIERQKQVLEGIDSMIATLLLVFFVLAFDLLHRFAKRIIKNFMGGDKNGTNS